MTFVGGKLSALRGWFAQAAGAMALPAPFALTTRRTRTGGPDPDGDDEDDELRRLMPILAAVITVAVIFGQ